MLKKIFTTLLALSFVSFANAEVTSNAKPAVNPDNSANSAKNKERFDVMKVDENEDTDTLAIPLDSSEVEDEEEIDRLERRPFQLEIPTKNQSQEKR